MRLKFQYEVDNTQLCSIFIPLLPCSDINKSIENAIYLNETGHETTLSPLPEVNSSLNLIVNYINHKPLDKGFIVDICIKFDGRYESIEVLLKELVVKSLVLKVGVLQLI